MRFSVIAAPHRQDQNIQNFSNDEKDVQNGKPKMPLANLQINPETLLGYNLNRKERPEDVDMSNRTSSSVDEFDVPMA